jgi:hypothetical protein
MNRNLTMTLAALVSMTPAVASAQTHEIYFHQTGALLQYSEAVVKILFAGITAKEFDTESTKRTMEELERAVSSAKNMVDRLQGSLPENMSSFEADLVKFRGEVKTAEDHLVKLKNDIEEQTGKGGDEEGGPDEEEGKTGPHDWDLLKKGCGWLANDLATAKGTYAKLAVRLKVKPVKAVPKPSGKRE